MKNYTITVNGNVYDVTVEESGSTAAPAPRKMAAAPAAAPTAAPAPAKAPAAGNVKVESPVAGKVFKIEAPVGTAVKRGDTIIIIEAMKMENPIVAPEDGTVASIDVAVGDAVETGAVLATLN